MTRLQRAMAVMGMNTKILAEYLQIDEWEAEAMERGEIPLSREAETIINESVSCEESFSKDCFKDYARGNPR